MIPVTQTTFGDGSDGTECGNCFAACIASILELPLSEVPNFLMERDWWAAAQGWVEARGFGLLGFPAPPTAAVLDFWPAAYLIISGKASRGLKHSCVGQIAKQPDGSRRLVIVHDPHPSRAGISAPQEEWEIEVFVALDPARSLNPMKEVSPE